MSNEEAVDIQRALKDNLYETGKDFPSSKAKGKWKWYGQGYESYPECSICNQTPKEPACDWNNVDMGDDYRYCPHCGADMRESEAKDDRTTKR